jgi:molecular chaperone GrpE
MKPEIDDLPPTDATEQMDGQAELNITAEELESLIREREEFRDQALRTLAEFQNYKKRNEQQMATLRKLATERLMLDLLPALDNFERAFRHAPNPEAPELDGMRSIYRQLASVLQSNDLKRIETVGQPFDAGVHDAIVVEPTTDIADGTILEELEAGYILADRVLRAAKVKVAKNDGAT